MSMSDTMKTITYIETLLEKSANADLASDAVNFAQAAYNVANAFHIITEIEKNMPLYLEKSSIA